MNSDIKNSLNSVYERIKEAFSKRDVSFPNQNVTLVAVSKTKPKEMIIEAYLSGQRHFGENYVGEIVEKASDPDILEQCPEIKWHYIGHLQSNKVNKVVTIPNLHVVETVDTEKLANVLDKSSGKQLKQKPLNIMVQVNTSAEPNKSGVAPEKVTHLVSHVLNNCQNLKFIGLMTIGATGHSQSGDCNPDFECLVNCRKAVCEKLELELEKVELSMGMSNDFEHAIAAGSTSVRVGSSIFGARNYSSAGDTTTQV